MTLPDLPSQQMTPEIYTGGFFQTNAYALPAANDGRVLIDAPEGSLDWTRENGWRVDALLLTHAHIDHVHDAAAVALAHKCPIYHHVDGLPLLLDRYAYRRYGLSYELEPVTGGVSIDETTRAEFCGLAFEIFAVPGHCPGSLCFYDAPAARVYAGDTLFAGSVGRSDLPGGDAALLIRKIREKLLTLPDDVRVFPGHGPATTIGDERAHNPFLQVQ